MNSEEGMSMAKMAVTVLLVVLIIGAVVGIVYAAYSWFGSGTDKLSDNVTSIGDSALSQYDDQTMDGSEVISALKNYRNSDMTIFIANLAVQGGDFNQNGTDYANCPVYCALPATAAGQAATTAGDNNTMVATLAKADVGGGVGEQFLIESFAYDPDDGITIAKNTNFSPTTTKSAANAFVRQNAQWYANLIYDRSTGDVAGIFFRQMN